MSFNDPRKSYLRTQNNRLFTKALRQALLSVDRGHPATTKIFIIVFLFWKTLVLLNKKQQKIYILLKLQ